ncbi:helicase-associated domain-containing protein, partial [bacterium]|nr:helicase-associated domain-containing protein [bacterium]
FSSITRIYTLITVIFIMKCCTLSDCIKKLNPFHLKKISEYNEIVLIPFSSNTARSVLIEKMSRPGFIGKSIDSLNDDRKNLLMIIYIFSQYVPVETIYSICIKLFANTDNLQRDTASMLSMGLFYCVENLKDAGIYYFIPDEFKSPFKQLAEERINSLVKRYDGEPAQAHISVNSVELSILSFLVIALKKEIKVNIGNKLNKRTLNKIESLLNLSFDNISEGTIDNYIHDIFDYTRNVGFIKYENELDLPLIEQWVKLPDADRKQLLFSGLIFKNKYKSPVAQFARLLSFLPDSRLFDINSLFVLCSLVSDVNLDCVSSFSKMPLDCYPVLLFYHLGIIELASNDIHCYCAWKITVKGARFLKENVVENENHGQADNIILQPNFELLISRTADFELLWKFYRIADLLQCDQMLRFQINKESIYRGLSTGIDKNSIIPLFEDNAKDKISQNVIYSLKEWCENYGSVYFMDIFLLRCKNKYIADQIKLHPKIRDYIKGNFSDTDLFVCKEDYEILMEELKIQGFMPLEDVVVPEEEAPVKQKVSFFTRISGKSILDRVKPLQFDLDKIKFIPEPSMVH